MKILKSICAITLLVSSIIVPIKEVQAKPSQCQATVNKIAKSLKVQPNLGFADEVFYFLNNESQPHYYQGEGNQLQPRSGNNISFSFNKVTIFNYPERSEQIKMVKAIAKECKGTGSVVFFPYTANWADSYYITNDGAVYFSYKWNYLRV